MPQSPRCCRGEGQLVAGGTWLGSPSVGFVIAHRGGYFGIGERGNGSGVLAIIEATRAGRLRLSLGQGTEHSDGRPWRRCGRWPLRLRQCGQAGAEVVGLVGGRLDAAVQRESAVDFCWVSADRGS
jgi:hypothetical protein